MKNKRLIFADFTKFFAMFVVTWGHCAQCLSGESYPWMFGRQGLSIAFHMPLFMMISGYFINPEKIECEKWGNYIQGKFFRLMVPAFMWYLLYCILTIHKPHPLGFVTFYWFLSSMFFSYIIVFVVCKLSFHISKPTIKNTLYLLSVFIVILIPYSSFLKVNFMYPMIWGGYFFKLLMMRSDIMRKYVLPVSAFLSIILLCYWDVKYSVYKSPFNSLEMSMSTVIALSIRLTTGGIVSMFFISLFNRMEDCMIARKLAKYGQYTLIMYTASFVLNGIMSRILAVCEVSITQPIWIELSSMIWAIFVCYICICAAILIEKNRMLCNYLLGKR